MLENLVSMMSTLQVGAGAFLQETAETVLEDEEGRQLLMEALMLYGVLLLLLEHIAATIIAATRGGQ